MLSPVSLKPENTTTSLLFSKYLNELNTKQYHSPLTHFNPQGPMVFPPKALHEVARSTTLGRLMYAAPAWWGFASAADRVRSDRFISRTIRIGYLPLHTIDASAMVADAEDANC